MREVQNPRMPSGRLVTYILSTSVRHVRLPRRAGLGGHVDAYAELADTMHRHDAQTVRYSMCHVRALVRTAR